MSENDVLQVLTMADIRDTDRLRRCIALGAPINARTWRWTPLGLAVQAGLVESCRILLDAGADPHSGGWDGTESLLCTVAEARFSDLNKLIGDAGPGIADDVMRALCRLLVERGVDPNGVANAEGAASADKCPLFLAVKNSDSEMVRCLVELGADIDVVCDECAAGLATGSVKTALRYAKDRVREDMMIELLRLGADDSCMNYGSLTGFQHCVETGLDKVVDYYLRERGEDLGQIAHIVTSRQTLQELAVKESTKELLRSFGAEAAVASAISCAVDGEEFRPISRPDRGLAL